jgi:hypothetical protein
MRSARIEDGFGQREDDKRCGRQADQQQPPGCLGWRFLTIVDADENACWREFDLLGARRHGAQQPVDKRQRCEAG